MVSKDMILLLVCAVAGVEALTTVGDLPTLHHEVAGTVLVVNETNLLIKNFTYDGTAPDAFFWIGTEGSPGSGVEASDGATWDHTAILAHPFTGQHYHYTDTDYPVLGRAEEEDILLTLPTRIQVSDIRWISVWCKAFKIDFGSLVFPENLLIESDVEDDSTDEIEDDDENSDVSHYIPILSAYPLPQPYPTLLYHTPFPTLLHPTPRPYPMLSYPSLPTLLHPTPRLYYKLLFFPPPPHPYVTPYL